MTTVDQRTHTHANREARTHAGQSHAEQVHNEQPAAASRLEQRLTIDGRDVVLILSLLAPHDHERVAATIANIAVAAATDPDMNRRSWRTFVEDVLSAHVSFSVDGDPDMHRVDWWDTVLRRAAIAFVHTNRLEPAIRRHVSLFASPRAVSLDWLPS